MFKNSNLFKMCFYSVQVVPNRGPSRSKAPILASDISLFTLEYKIEQILTVNNFEQKLDVFK